jgi:putative membrane protein
VPPWLLLLTVLGFLIVSGIDPQADRLTWFMETLPVMIGAVVLIATYTRFPLTPLTYHLIALHAFVLMVGGYYTYAEVPLFNGLRDDLGLARNHYDRIAHVVQGFVPAIIAREVLIRLSCLKPGGWLFLLTTAFCLAFSALYELIEWAAAIFTESGATAFLGTQGDPWDTQWDMFLALCGAICAQLLLSAWHNHQIETLQNGHLRNR